MNTNYLDKESFKQYLREACDSEYSAILNAFGTNQSKYQNASLYCLRYRYALEKMAKANLLDLDEMAELELHCEAQLTELYYILYEGKEY